MENTFPFNESEIVFEENFKPKFSYGSLEEIIFADQKANHSNPFEYYITYRQYKLDTNSGNLINDTDQLIEKRSRLLSFDRRIKDHLTHGSVVNDLKMSRKLFLLNGPSSLFNEQGCITHCQQFIISYEIVSHLYCDYFEIYSCLSVPPNRGCERNQLFGGRNQRFANPSDDNIESIT